MAGKNNKPTSPDPGIEKLSAIPLWGENSFAAKISDVPLVSPREFKDICVGLCASGIRLSGLCVLPG